MRKRPVLQMPPSPMPILLLAALLVALASLSGCSWKQAKRNYDRGVDFVFDTAPTAAPLGEEDETPIIELNYEAADHLMRDLHDDLAAASSILVHPLADASGRKNASPFGRLVAEQLAARISQWDVDVEFSSTAAPATPSATASAPTPAPTGADGGAAPDAPEVAPDGPPLAATELTGNYLTGENVIYLSATVADMRSGRIYSGWQWTLPLNRNTMSILPMRQGSEDGLTPTVQRQF